MQFRFECFKPSDLENNLFPDIEYPTALRVVHEFEISDATRWDNIMLQFAKFLDAIGYVGVSDIVSKRIDEEWEFVTKGIDDEDISNPGCTD
jgi:hypothetical protein